MSRPLQNRVRPDGAIVADTWRGTRMGNRGGRIHQNKQIVRRWASKQWIICVLAFKDRHREVMGDGYTELFFLDEASALAAGHRPCFECQRARALEFAHAFPLPGRARAADMDALLHKERLAERRYEPVLNLPEASFVEIDGVPCLWQRGLLHPWSADGYLPGIKTPRAPVPVLTPQTTCAALAAGYRPQLHGNAEG
ncbi:hypothetical protein [Halovulum sp. GXIMD14793]